LADKKKRKKSYSSDKYYFDHEAVERVKRFFRLCCTHSKGEWAGQPFILEPWQDKKIIAPLFGWKRKVDGLRKHRTCYAEIAKKNGKSLLASSVGLYLTGADDEPGAEVYAFAAEKDQARIVFDGASIMCNSNEELASQCEVFRNQITFHATNSYFRVLSAEAYSKQGYNCHGIIGDELHEQPNRLLYDTLRRGTAARRQPVEFYITNAGWDRHSICWEVHDYAERVKRGAIKDDTFLPVIYKAADGADWTDPRVWGQANPNLGISVKKEFLANECKLAQDVPANENSFRRFHLTQWTKQEIRWMPMKHWNKCPSREPEESFRGRMCYSGLDLATTTDIAALGHVFPSDGGFFDVIMRFWIPEEQMESRIKRDKVPYDLWEKQGWIHATPGNVIDYGYIYETIDQDAQMFDIAELAFDRWGATKIIQDLQGRDMEVIQFGQGFTSMSPPTKELLKLVLSGKLRHGNNPVLNWMADNVVVEIDGAGNIKPSKKKSTEKIDGIVALVMAQDRADRNEGSNKSTYDEKDLVMI